MIAAEFDKFSSRYGNILDEDLKLSGEKAEYFARYKAARLRRCLGADFRGNILDYGCGIGLVARSIRGYFDDTKAKIFGYDVSKKSIIAARENVKGVTFIDDLEDLKAGDFEVVVAANVLHHVKKGERPVLLKNIKSLLKKGGYLFVFEHNPYNPLTRYVVKSSVLDEGADLLSLRYTVRLLQDAGIRIHEKRYIMFFPNILKYLRSLEPVMGRIPLGAQYLCIGRVQ